MTWINESSAVGRAEYKSRQLQFAHPVGLTVPNTMIANQPDEVAAFASEAGGAIITKTLYLVPGRWILQSGQRVEEAGRRAELASMTEGLAGVTEFPNWLHISAIGLRLQFEQELAVLHWAGEQMPAWRGTGDPAGWDMRAALAELVAESRSALDDR